MATPKKTHVFSKDERLRKLIKGSDPVITT